MIPEKYLYHKNDCPPFKHRVTYRISHIGTHEKCGKNCLTGDSRIRYYEDLHNLGTVVPAVGYAFPVWCDNCREYFQASHFLLFYYGRGGRMTPEIPVEGFEPLKLSDYLRQAK